MTFAVQGLCLLLLARAEPAEFLRRLADNDSNVTDVGNATDVNGTDVSSTENATNVSAGGGTTVAAVVSTTQAVLDTTTAMLTRTPEPAAAADSTGLVVILIIIGALIVFGFCGAAVYGLVTYKQNAARENIRLVKQVDGEAADFEANLTSLQGHVQKVSHRLEQDKEKKEAVSKEFQMFQTKWKSIEVQSREFLDLQYTKCLRERQEEQRQKDLVRRQKQQRRQAEAKRRADAQLQAEIRKKSLELEKEDKQKQKESKAKGEVVTPKTKKELDAMAAELVRAGQEDSGRASLVIGASRSNLVPDEEVGLWPNAPVTSNRELRLQLKSMETLRNGHQATVTELKALRDQAGIKGLEDLELRVSSEAKPQGWWSGGSYLEEQVKLLNGFAHPLLRSFQVKPHGVLGTTEGQKELPPLSPVEAVVVDPAGFPFIGYRNSCRGAGGASGSIYKWLNLAAPPGSGRFPPEVNRHFAASREVEAEGRAKLHVYSSGMVVIHTVGPKLRDLLPGVQSLSRTYLNVLTEYCQAILLEDRRKGEDGEKGKGGKGGKGKGPVPIPRVLRLCPISSGIFCEDARLQPHMAEITWAALALALAMLPLELQELLKTLQLEVCVFQSREVNSYKSSLESKAVAAGPLKLVGQGKVPAHAGGYDWVRKQNGTQDRLERLGAFMNTAQALAAAGYVRQGEKDQTLQIKAMLDGTRIHRAEPRPEDSEGASDRPPNAAAGAGSAVSVPAAEASAVKVLVAQDGDTVLDAGVKVSQAGRKAVIVNAASAYSVGGGVMSGGRHALEESCCITSSLLASLQKAQWDQLQNPEEKPGASRSGHSGHSDDEAHAHVPVNGCIVSPQVQVFREGSNDGYGFLPSPVTLQGICSVAMFNMNPRVSDSPLDAPRDFKEYCRQVKLKFRSVASAALDLGAEVLVCPDVGCGVFANDPQVLGTLLGQVLREPEMAKLEVLLTGQVAFAQAVQKAASGAQVELSPAPVAYFSQVYGKPYSKGGRKGGGAPQEPMVVATLVKPGESSPSAAPSAARPVVKAAAVQPTVVQPAGVQPAGAQPAAVVQPTVVEPIAVVDPITTPGPSQAAETATGAAGASS